MCVCVCVCVCDGAAAMRYTEARMSKIAMEMLKDINKDTIDYADLMPSWMMSNCCCWLGLAEDSSHIFEFFIF